MTTCLSCGGDRLEPVLDLGPQPLANNLLSEADLTRPEPMFPLGIQVCGDCWLMQLTHLVPAVDLFSDYLYFSSFSGAMLEHARLATERYTKDFGLNKESFVVEIASNDGYLLKNFVASGVPCLGIEPAANIAKVAEDDSGVPTRVCFFGKESALAVLADYNAADLILGNNVFAHAPDINDFVDGLSSLIAPKGRIVLEFPYAVDLLNNKEFDTIYHEHVFYFSLTPLLPIFRRCGLTIYDVERLTIHGGSLRLFVCREGAYELQESVTKLIAVEATLGATSLGRYKRFRREVARVKSDLLVFLAAQKKLGCRVAGYGASAKGSTLLNYLGEDAGVIEFLADRNTWKQGKFSPGLHLPIVPAEELAVRQPDFAMLLVWNFAEEILAQQASYTLKGGRFVIPLPELRISDSDGSKKTQTAGISK